MYAGLMNILVGDPGEYKKKHTYRVRFARYYRFHDKDLDRQLQPFRIPGEPVMAYSRKDAIKRWVHADLKNRKKRSRR